MMQLHAQYSMQVYQTQFKKKDGQLRDIKFVKPFSENADAQFFEKNVKGIRNASLAQDNERVWDIENQGIRIINFGELTQPVDCIGEANYDESTNTFICNE